MTQISGYKRGVLLRALRVIADAEVEGRSLPARDLATALGMAQNSGHGLRKDLVDEGWLVIHEQGGGRPSRTSVTDTGWQAIGGRKAVSPHAGARKCLCCGRVFESAWAGNRICGNCRQTDAYRGNGLDGAYQVPL